MQNYNFYDIKTTDINNKFEIDLSYTINIEIAGNLSKDLAEMLKQEFNVDLDHRMQDEESILSFSLKYNQTKTYQVDGKIRSRIDYNERKQHLTTEQIEFETENSKARNYIMERDNYEMYIINDENYDNNLTKKDWKFKHEQKINFTEIGGNKPSYNLEDQFVHKPNNNIFIVSSTEDKEIRKYKSKFKRLYSFKYNRNSHNYKNIENNKNLECIIYFSPCLQRHQGANDAPHINYYQDSITPYFNSKHITKKFKEIAVPVYYPCQFIDSPGYQDNFNLQNTRDMLYIIKGHIKDLINYNEAQKKNDIINTIKSETEKEMLNKAQALALNQFNNFNQGENMSEDNIKPNRKKCLIM